MICASTNADALFERSRRSRYPPQRKEPPPPKAPPPGIMVATAVRAGDIAAASAARASSKPKPPVHVDAPARTLYPASPNSRPPVLVDTPAAAAPPKPKPPVYVGVPAAPASPKPQPPILAAATAIASTTTPPDTTWLPVPAADAGSPAALTETDAPMPPSEAQVINQALADVEPSLTVGYSRSVDWRPTRAAGESIGSESDTRDPRKSQVLYLRVVA
jgi:hypothetical protein